MNLEMLLDRILNIFLTYEPNTFFEVVSLFSAYLKLILVFRVEYLDDNKQTSWKTVKESGRCLI